MFITYAIQRVCLSSTCLFMQANVANKIENMTNLLLTLGSGSALLKRPEYAEQASKSVIVLMENVLRKIELESVDIDRSSKGMCMCIV